MGVVTVTVPADEQSVHPVLWSAPGVADAARAVDAAKRAVPELVESRRREHGEWRRRNAEGALQKGFEPGPEPPPDVQHDEMVKLRAQQRSAEIRLEAVVVANEDAVVEGLREWETTAVARAREYVAALQGICVEAALAGKALTAVANAQHRAAGKQSPPRVADLIYLVAKGEDVALVDFGDGRAMWLQVTGRA